MFKMGLSAFSGYQGGASAGAGCTQEAMTDVCKHNNKARHVILKKHAFGKA